MLAVGVVAWNAGCVTGQKRAELIEPTLAAFPADVREDLRCVLDELIRRKETLFAGDRRVILNYELTRLPDGSPHLQVVFSPTQI
jgi:hypothetical protein